MAKTWWREFHAGLKNPKDRTTGVKTSKESNIKLVAGTQKTERKKNEREKARRGR